MIKLFTIIFVLLCLAINCQFTYDENISRKLAGFSIQAYCTTPNIPLNNCGAPCNQNPQGLKDFTELYNKEYNARIICGYSPDSNAIIYSFRGTMDFTNWLTNLSGLKTDYKYCTGCKVHSGFSGHYDSLKSQIESSFKQLKLKYPNAKVYLTGHSLGAAVATIGLPHFYSLNGNKPIDTFYHFSSPRVGNKEFSDWFKGQNFALQYARVTHGKDLVVQNPTSWFPLFYKHSHNEVYYSDFDNANKSFKLCQNPEDSSCGAQSQYFAFDIKDHLDLFGWNMSNYIKLCSV